MQNEPIKLAEKFANSPKFKQLFSDGMTLVEESASYLDGQGREEAKRLPRSLAVHYGTESMRLTTRLMQLASWLLLQRSASAGEMSREQMLDEKKKVKLHQLSEPQESQHLAELPPEFRDLVERSFQLQARILKLDGELYGDNAVAPETPANPVNQQIDLLSTAFGTKRS